MGRLNRTFLLGLAAMLFAGCTPSLAETFVPELSHGDTRPCGEGFEGSDGVRCQPILPTDACLPGTMARLGSTTCVPVGWTVCPVGFVADSLGWGCTPQLPSTACSDTTSQRLGSTTCQDVSDCAAPFPPASATVFVDPAGALDATHFHTIAAAVAAAPSGATIAVSPGSYAETLQIARAVNLVGRCASQVELRSPGTATPGVLVGGGGALQLSGMTIRGHMPGVSVSAGGSAVVQSSALLGNRDVQVLIDGPGSSLTLRDSVVRDAVAVTGASWGRGIMAQGGATVTLEHVSLEHNQAVSVLVLDPGTTAHLSDCVVRDTAPSAAGDGLGLALEGAGTVEITRSAFVANRGRAISVKVGALTLTQSTLQDTLARPSGTTGFGLSVSQRGSADITSSAITHNRSLGVSLADVGSRVALTDSIVHRTQASSMGEMGIEASDGTTLTLLRTAVLENVSVGLGLFGANTTLTQSLISRTLANQNRAAVALNLEGGKLDARDSSFVANDSGGLLINEPNLATAKEHTFVGCLVMDTVPLAGGGPGRGVSVQGGLVAFEHSAIIGNSEVAIFLRHAGTRVRATDSALLNTHVDPDTRYGLGVVARDGAVWQSTNTDVRGNAAAGLAFADATGSVDRGLIGDQPVGLETQGATTLAAVRALSVTPPSNVLEVTDATTFVANGSKVGSGNIPLPSQ